MQALRLKLFATATFLIASTAYGYDAVYDLPGTKDAMVIPSSELAERIRVLSHYFVGVVPWVRGGRVIRTLRDEGKVVNVTTRNVNHWERVFATRLENLKAAARVRGYPRIDGTYSVRIEPSGCILREPAPQFAVIVMRDVEFDIKFSPSGSVLSGVAIGDFLDLPLYGGNQPDPFFSGSIESGQIHLRNKMSCVFRLIRTGAESVKP